MKKIVRFLSVILIVLSMSFAAGCTFIQGSIVPGQSTGNNSYTPPTAKQEISLPTSADGGSSTRQSLSSIDAVKAVEKSVVAIEVGTTESTSAGAGVLVDISIDGQTESDIVYVITCHHVISSEGATVRVKLSDPNGSYDNEDYIFGGVIGGSRTNYEYAVSLVGGDKTSDLAVLRIDLDKPAWSEKKLNRSEITTAVLPPNNYSVSKGEQVFAIGNPTGALPGWYADGSVSLIETVTSVSDIGEMKLMGINVPTNHGNSGGGLFNMYGELIGITNAGSDEYTAINFAIPLYTSDAGKTGVIDNGVVNIVTSLLKTETATNYGYIAGRKAKFGFTISNPENNTVLVKSVTQDGLAYNAGFRANDVIIAYKLNDNQTVSSFTYNDVIAVMDGLTVGDTVDFTISRTVQVNAWQTKNETHTFRLTSTQFHFCNTGK